MSALRKAGVWLGLIEDDEDRGYGYEDRSYDDEYPDDELTEAGARVRARVAGRLAETRSARVAERAAGRRGTDRAASDRQASDRRASDRFDADRFGADRFDSERYADERYDSDRFEPSDINHETADLATERDAGLGYGDRPAERDFGGETNLRPMSRPMTATAPVAGGSASTTYPVRDNLALAPEPRIDTSPRAATVSDGDRRYQITTLHPTTYNEARTIGEHFRDGVPVIMNLTEMAEADAKRLVDFAAGLAFGLRGTMERVTNRVFLLSPADIRVTDEDRARIAEGGYFLSS
jgi:cell division inhibitor SepF